MGRVLRLTTNPEAQNKFILYCVMPGGRSGMRPYLPCSSSGLYDFPIIDMRGMYIPGREAISTEIVFSRYRISAASRNHR